MQQLQVVLGELVVQQGKAHGDLQGSEGRQGMVLRKCSSASECCSSQSVCPPATNPRGDLQQQLEWTQQAINLLASWGHLPMAMDCTLLQDVHPTAVPSACIPRIQQVVSLTYQPLLLGLQQAQEVVTAWGEGAARSRQAGQDRAFSIGT